MSKRNCWSSLSPPIVLISVLILVLLDFVEAEEPYCEPENGQTCAAAETQQPPSCLLFAGIERGAWRTVAGVPITQGSSVGPPSPMMVINDANRRESSIWHDWIWDPDIAPDVGQDIQFSVGVFIPGLGSLVECGDTVTNVQTSSFGRENPAGVHRSQHHTAGSFATRFGYELEAQVDIPSGRELLVTCGGGSSISGSMGRPLLSYSFMEENLQCIDRGLTKQGSSNVVGAGRGLFAAYDLEKGTIISTSPVIPIDKHDLDIVDQSFRSPWKEKSAPEVVFNASHVKGQQLLLNYCFGHSDSSLLLLPLGPLVHSINHDRQNPNIGIRWSESSDLSKYFNFNPSELMMEEEPFGLSFDYFLLRDVNEGEELLMDYGKEWQEAFEDHRQNYRGDANYKSALEYNVGNTVVMTTQEQVDSHSPYPSNIRTGCFYTPNFRKRRKRYDSNTEGGDPGIDHELVPVTWTAFGAEKCLRPCDIQHRNADGEYTARMYATQGNWTKDICDIPSNEIHVVSNIPRAALYFVDELYSTDQHLTNAFRYHIGTPPDLFPTRWMKQPVDPNQYFKETQLASWELAQVRWEEDGVVVANYSYEIGLDPSLTEGLLEYCRRTGISDAFRHLLVNGNPLEPGNHVFTQLGDHQWYIQRPEAHWLSNMHWISPASEVGHHEYLQALSAAGFDNALKSIGEYFGFGGLVVYHVTFIGVSHCTQGFIHWDFKKVQGKAFNVIIPLVLANETGPELDLVDSEGEVGGYKYRYHAASMVGDFAEHATAAVDYRSSKEIRIAATVYIADMTEKNRKRLVKDFTQAYPNKEDTEHVFESAGRHWKPDIPSRHLPKPFVPADHRDTDIHVGGIVPLQWGGKFSVENLFEMVLPKELIPTIHSYLSMMGILDKFEGLFSSPSSIGEVVTHTALGKYWQIQRHEEVSNIHLASPADRIAFNDIMSILVKNQFNEVLESLGRSLGMTEVAIYQIMASGYSYSRRPSLKTSIHSGAELYRIDIPVISKELPALDIKIEDDTFGQWAPKNNTALIMGDGVRYATTRRDDYGKTSMLVMLSVWVGNVENDLLEHVMGAVRTSYIKGGINPS